MLPKLEHGRTVAVPRTHAVQQRSPRIQTSGIFRFPLELFLEILSYFTDHRRYIRENFNGRVLSVYIERKHAERSIVIRRLTMTCWPLRTLFLPLLWADAEGCVSHIRYNHRDRTGGLGFGLYAQCVYLSLNPMIAAYVQTFSIELFFSRAPEDLMEKIVNCLVGLPNLKTLEILHVSSRALVSKALRRKYAVFPSIRVLRITNACHHFIRNCPNLEDLTFTAGLDKHASKTLRSHGQGLKRIAGVGGLSQSLSVVGLGCPNLREIDIVDVIRPLSENIKHLRQLKHLAIIDLNLYEETELPKVDREQTRKTWKREFIGLLKDSPSPDRRILRWKVVQGRLCHLNGRFEYDVVEAEELEVFPETSL